MNHWALLSHRRHMFINGRYENQYEDSLTLCNTNIFPWWVLIWFSHLPGPVLKNTEKKEQKMEAGWGGSLEKAFWRKWHSSEDWIFWRSCRIGRHTTDEEWDGSKKTLPTRAEGQVGNKSKEGRVEQDPLMELLDSGQTGKEFGLHLTGNGESLKDFEQVEQGKDVTC